MASESYGISKIPLCFLVSEKHYMYFPFNYLDICMCGCKYKNIFDILTTLGTSAVELTALSG
jgi:hypothetical protein